MAGENEFPIGTSMDFIRRLQAAGIIGAKIRRVVVIADCSEPGTPVRVLTDCYADLRMPELLIEGADAEDDRLLDRTIYDVLCSEVPNMGGVARSILRTFGYKTLRDLVRCGTTSHQLRQARLVGPCAIDRLGRALAGSYDLEAGALMHRTAGRE